MRRIEILVDTDSTAEKLIAFLTSPAVTEMLTNAGGKIEGIANLPSDSLVDFGEESHYMEDDRNTGGNSNGKE